MLPLLLFAVTFAVLLTGYPVALTLAGVSLIFAALGILTGTFDAVSYTHLTLPTTPYV